jgi:hypothetical protein
VARDRIDTRQFVAIMDGGARRIAIGESFASALSNNSWPFITYVPEVRRLGGDDGRIVRRSEVGRRDCADGMFHLKIFPAAENKQRPRPARTDFKKNVRVPTAIAEDD